jgi:hypothetical protein
MEFTSSGLGNAADDRSPVLVLRERCVAGRLAFPASSLALPPTRLAPADDGPSRHSASRRRSTSIAASGSSTHPSAPLRSPCLLPGPAHAGLLSWGRTDARFAPDTWPNRPSVGFAPSCEGPSARPLPAMGQAHHHRPPDAIRKSRSDLVVSHHLAGFLRAAARRLVASCSRPWGSPRFTRTSRSQPRSPRRDHPSKDFPIRS